jgi:GNAT superfamily N-acetyltransferase
VSKIRKINDRKRISSFSGRITKKCLGGRPFWFIAAGCYNHDIMADEPIPSSPMPVTLRSYREGDRDACRRLYTDGLLGGQLAGNDTGIDIDDIESAYMRVAGSHFWVAEDGQGELVGMIGIQQCELGVGEIRRLRVRQDYRRRGIGTLLVEKAIQLCAEQGYLKVTLDTYMERDPAIHLFGKFGFKHSETKKVGDKDLLFFYLDLYTRKQGSAHDRPQRPA